MCVNVLPYNARGPTPDPGGGEVCYKCNRGCVISSIERVCMCVYASVCVCVSYHIMREDQLQSQGEERYA